MTVDATMHVRTPGKASAYLDWIQMVTGLALALFMLEHLLMISSVLLGPSVMTTVAEHFESTGLAHVGGPLIGLIFLVHFVVAARKLPFRALEQVTAWRHARMMRHGDTWLWMVQAGTAMIILLLGAIHMWTQLTDLPITAEKSAARMQEWGWALFYIALLPLVEIHIWAGVWRIGVKWGFITRANRAKWKRWMWRVFLIALAIGGAAIARYLTLDVSGYVPHAEEAEAVSSLITTTVARVA